MKRTRFSDEQIIAILKEHEAGIAVAELCRKHGVSDASIYKWKAKYGGMDVSEAKRLKSLEDENTQLKRLLADAMLDNAALKDLLGKMYGPPRPCKGRDCSDDAVCLNVSGLSRVDRCCGQAMMRCARIVPNKWFGHSARFFAQGLRRADQLSRHHSPEPRSLFRSGRNGLAPLIKSAGPRQNDPGDPSHFGGKRDDGFIVVHAALQRIEPRPKSIA